MVSPGDKDGVKAGAVGDRPLKRPKCFSQGDGPEELGEDVGVKVDVRGGELGEKYDEMGWSGEDETELSDRGELGEVEGRSKCEEYGKNDSPVIGESGPVDDVHLAHNVGGDRVCGPVDDVHLAHNVGGDRMCGPVDDVHLAHNFLWTSQLTLHSYVGGDRMCGPVDDVHLAHNVGGDRMCGPVDDVHLAHNVGGDRMCEPVDDVHLAHNVGGDRMCEPVDDVHLAHNVGGDRMCEPVDDVHLAHRLRTFLPEAVLDQVIGALVSSAFQEHGMEPTWHASCFSSIAGLSLPYCPQNVVNLVEEMDSDIDST
ncbi:hypothetical protein BLNAU_18635 [Blattamonas nauphoetae]|uniref:Uncharacterized protein n=1 Tax=Blattamonas nauphoetae TaxID=2049346 RepID=A0ABQ9X460_9EUKA|nr:hypothetical protein BLNAU_18635 [Blattamonas nauphoetae]